jgi:cell division protease FtsH
MKYETIDRHQIDDIMNGRVPSPPKDWVNTPSAGAGSAGDSSTKVEDIAPIGKTATSH